MLGNRFGTPAKPGLTVHLIQAYSLASNPKIQGITISMKESQLIGHVSLNIEDNIEESSSLVRIISPKEECGKDITDNNLDFNVMKSLDIQDMQIFAERQGDLLGDREIEDLQQSLNTSCLDKDKKARILIEMSSYGALMEHIDQKLSEIERTYHCIESLKLVAGWG